MLSPLLPTSELFLRKAEDYFILSLADYVVSALSKAEESIEWELVIRCRAITNDRGNVKVTCRVESGGGE